jgi:hypothetical protein
MKYFKVLRYARLFKEAELSTGRIYTSGILVFRLALIHFNMCTDFVAPETSKRDVSIDFYDML